MGLRCLLGHDFGNREVERERQEDGNEVVVTYRTVETCQRCGDRRIVSENKEVRSIRTEDEMQTGLGSGVDVTASAESESDPSSEPATELEDDGAEIVENPTDAIDVAEAEAGDAPAEETAADDSAGRAEPTADEGGGIILTDDGDEPERERGQWPDADVNDRSDPAAGAESGSSASSTSGAGERGSASSQNASRSDETVILGDGDDWPEHESEDEGFDAEPGESSDTDVSFGGSLTPEANSKGATNGEATFADARTETAPETDKEFVRADDADVDIDRREPGTKSEFYCPNCGHSRLAGESSMRAGDICPDCRKGYIAERDA